MSHSSAQWKIILAFALVYIIWGSTYFAILIALKSIPPFAMISLRLLLAGILLLTFRLFAGDSWPSWSRIAKNSLSGILTLFGGLASVTWAEQYISSSLAAIIVTAVPFWFLVFDRKHWGVYFSNRFILSGLMLGFAGVAILVGFSHPYAVHGANPSLSRIAPMVIIAGGIAWTLGSLYSKNHAMGDSLLTNAALQFLAAGAFSGMAALVAGEWRKFHFSTIGPAAWSALGYLTIMGSLVTYLAYIWLLGKRPAAQVSTYVYVNPVIAVLLGALAAHEHITALQLLALTIILGGVIMVNANKYFRRPVEDLDPGNNLSR